MVGTRRNPGLGRRAVAILAGLALASAIPAAQAVASDPGPAACQEYSVCGGPTGGSGAGRPLVAPSSPHPVPGVGSRTTLPLTGYPLTPALAILAAIVALALIVRVALGLARRGRRRDGPTSAPAR